MNESDLRKLLRIDENEIAERRRFLAFTDEDEKNLEIISTHIAGHVEAITSDFYDHLLEFADLSERFLHNSSILERLRETQKKYLLTLGREADQPEYFEERLRIGFVHENMKLEQKWYLGGYAKFFDSISRGLAGGGTLGPERLRSVLATLFRLMLMDAILAVESYTFAGTERIERGLHELSEAQLELQRLSRLDGLTQVFNRSHLMDVLEQEIARSRRFDHAFSLLMIDIDRFKAINDRFGHMTGDAVIKGTAQRMRTTLRPSDILGRYGGAEFAVGLIECDSEVASGTAERVRAAVAEAPVLRENGEIAVTVSIGVAVLDRRDAGVESLVEAADRALYAAKEAGRNQVKLHPG